MLDLHNAWVGVRVRGMFYWKLGGFLSYSHTHTNEENGRGNVVAEKYAILWMVFAGIFHRIYHGWQAFLDTSLYT